MTCRPIGYIPECTCCIWYPYTISGARSCSSNRVDHPRTIPQRSATRFLRMSLSANATHSLCSSRTLHVVERKCNYTTKYCNDTMSKLNLRNRQGWWVSHASVLRSIFCTEPLALSYSRGVASCHPTNFW